MNAETQCNFFQTGYVEKAKLIEYVSWLSNPHNPSLPLIELPPFQRGDVWKIAQIEQLWDSVLRGFPIGSFLLAPLKTGELAQGFDSRKQEPTARDGWFLLDGQQRSRALLLGFSSKISQTARLWIDMAPEAGAVADRAFLFRLCTERHPWGMEQSDPDRKVEDAARRDARKQLRENGTRVRLCNDFGLSLRDTWPVRAMLPVPITELLERVRNSQGNDAAIKWDDLLPSAKSKNFEKHRNHDCEEQIIKAIRKFLIPREVVLLKLNPDDDPKLDHPRNEGTSSEERRDVPDAMETLFVRINSGGTRLEGDEMMYSLLKAKWRRAPTLVQGIVDHEKAGFLLQPTTIVLCAARLARARLTNGSSKGEADVAKPKVRQFRRWIAEKGEDGKSDGRFLEEMKRFIGTSEKLDEPRFVRAVLTFLEAAQYRGDLDIGLPRPLLQSLNPLAIDVVLRWIDCRLDYEDFKIALDGSRLPILRFLIHSLLAWTHPEEASKLAFKVLSDDENDRFPCGKIYEHLISKKESAPVAIGMPNHGTVANHLLSTQGKKGLRSYEDLFSGELCGEFVRRFWNQKVMLLWFQRAHLERLFPGYDPLKMRSDAPFDYDHILPASHLSKQGKSPKFEADIVAEESKNFRDRLGHYRDSIGNYRIWPCRENRADQDKSPVEKLGLNRPDELVSGDLSNEFSYKYWREIPVASSIHHDHIELWTKASGEKLDWTSFERREYFQRAVEMRVVWLYQSLYEALQFRDWEV